MTKTKKKATQPKTKTIIIKALPPCHKVTEVMPGLFLGKKSQVPIMTDDLHLDVLVPLDSLEGDCWDEGWRGEIFYVPTTDFSVLPRDVAVDKAQQVANMIAAGKRVGIFCIGGHGRTGYFGSLVAGLLGAEDPIALVRTYCAKTIESAAQIKEIAEILKKPELTKYKPPHTTEYAGYGIYDDMDWWSGKLNDTLAVMGPVNHCVDCLYRDTRANFGVLFECLRHKDKWVSLNSLSCGLYDCVDNYSGRGDAITT